MLQPGELAPSLEDDVAATDGGAAAAAAGAGADGGLGVATGGGSRGGGGIRGPSTKAVVDCEMPRLARMVHRSREGISKMIDAFLDSTPEGTPPASKAQIRVAINAIAEYAQPAGAPKSAAKCWLVHAEKLKELGLYEELETTPVAMAPLAQQPAAPIGKPLLAGLQLAAAQAAARAHAAAATQEQAQEQAQAQAQDQAVAAAHVQVAAAFAAPAAAASEAPATAPASVANPAVKNNFMRSFLSKSADKAGKELPQPRMSEDAPTKEDKEEADLEDPPAGPLGTIVWAKQAGYVYWPAIVAREAQGPDRHKREGGWTFVRYFGTNQVGYCKLTMPWAEGKEKCLKEAEEAQKKKPASVRGFKQGVEEAEAEIAKNNFMRLLSKSDGKSGSDAEVPTSAPADSSPAPLSAASSGSSALETPALTAAPPSFGPPDCSGGNGGGSGGGSAGSGGGSGGEGSDLEVVKTLFGSAAVATSAARTPSTAAEGANELCTPRTGHADSLPPAAVEMSSAAEAKAMEAKAMEAMEAKAMEAKAMEAMEVEAMEVKAMEAMEVAACGAGGCIPAVPAPSLTSA